jgi:uncharacterized protein YqjF (DUF2071 family)
MTTVIDPPHKAGDGIAGPRLGDAVATREPCPQAFAWPVRRPLLWAEWRHLVMLNYEIDPEVLQPYIPAGTELDFWEGKTYASIVGFQFLNARLMGVRIPFHSNFEEVNLRFYVRRRAEEGWRRGVVFIREIAPRWAVAVTARLLYGENYLCVPMTHKITYDTEENHEAPQRVEYRWRLRHQPRHVLLETSGYAYRPAVGSHEEFIVEHYWGYSSLPRGRAKEYCVAHRPWRISPATSVEFNCDVATLYGPQFATFLKDEPASAFWADGSAVRVYPGRRL